MIAWSSADRLSAVTLDSHIAATLSPMVEHEQRIAIHDLLDANHFRLHAQRQGPYRLHLALPNGQLRLQVFGPQDELLQSYTLSLSPLRQFMRDYSAICQHYDQARQRLPRDAIEAIDIGRRGLHDQAAGVLSERLKGKIDCDFATCRRLFTLLMTICVKI